LVCRPGAIREVLRETGKLETGLAGPVQFVHGLLNIGEAMSAPLIRQVKAAAPEADLVIVDSPPGTSCPVIESVRGTDFVALVTEPTPFGLNDLKLAVGMVRAMKLPFGVVINRAGFGDQETQEYCRRHGIEILAEIPDDRRVAEEYSRGGLACKAVPEFRIRLEGLLARLCDGNRTAPRVATPEPDR
jgi:MinD superfamily P-loop ATPase